MVAIQEAGTLKKLERPQIEALLLSDSVEIFEDVILEALLDWCDGTRASVDETKELIRMARLPFVPVDSPLMGKIVKNKLVPEDIVRVAQLFQTDRDYRATVINSEPQYRPRLTPAIKREMHRKIRPPSPDWGGMICRMLGPVNGRDNFELISTVRHNENRNALVCDFSNFKVPVSLVDAFGFGSCNTLNKAVTSNRPEKTIDKTALECMPVDSVKELLEAMIIRENELRLHSLVQVALGKIGEDEGKMSSFITDPQTHVANEFNVDPLVGINLIRSATSLFPETAKLAHYVKHNRCFSGPLCAGDEAPDVSVSTMTGKRSTLWTEIDRHRCRDRRLGGAVQVKPVVILGASYT